MLLALLPTFNPGIDPSRPLAADHQKVNQAEHL
jgi:hypothetical protein